MKKQSFKLLFILAAVFFISSSFITSSKGLFSTDVESKVVKDTDADGIIDQYDKCPDTPAGVPVNPEGCPIFGDPTDEDLDGDGVPNEFDACPGTPLNTQVNSFGCPL
ncbi:thrombospondin type 3 repeat-containing protein [Sphingobacterium sp. DR205]|uniref:thrombospondin type 3 repeat-containing protein n=1 Tax=Sphingobacterium sp. DR205 TaxID=2713573 RepID=UPI0013E412F4|nr:thrombospondin type 3 repeat-containing protein [Sphingobacterium sp. DR205]QIH35952.1 hypothetical protein G6053_25100 [Sphingobacterium sp. DR205]